MNDEPVGEFSPTEWAHAGRALLCCSGLLCLALALYRGEGLVAEMLRTYVGLFGGGVTLFSIRQARR